MSDSQFRVAGVSVSQVCVGDKNACGEGSTRRPMGSRMTYPCGNLRRAGVTGHHDRSHLEPYLDITREFRARRVLDLGCGTGVFALLLAECGSDVTGVDPAAGSLDVHAKRGSSRVRWIHGDATTLPRMQVDLAVMTGNAAQAIVDSKDWAATLDRVREALRLGGRSVFETRDPARRAWEEWTEARTRTTTTVPGVGAVEHWVEVTDVSWPLVTFCGTYVFGSDGQVLTSGSTLRFHERSEIEADLTAHGYEVQDVRDAPDRPGRELVVVARRAR